MSTLIVTKLIHHSLEIPTNEKGLMNYGEFINRYIEDCINEGEAVHSVAIEFSEPDWKAIAQAYAQAPLTKASTKR